MAVIRNPTPDNGPLTTGHCRKASLKFITVEFACEIAAESILEFVCAAKLILEIAVTEISC